MSGPPCTESWEPHWARRLYRVLAPAYDVLRSLWSLWTQGAENDLDQLFATRIGPNARVLDLAPGTGINLVRLCRKAPSFASYLGIDISDSMLTHARRKAHGDRRVTLRIGDATDLSGVEGDFDFIVCTWLLSHLDCPADAVRGAVARLAPGGTAVFVFFTAPRSRLLRGLGWLGIRVFRGRYVDPAPISSIPHLERIAPYALGFATLVAFHAAA